MLVIASNLTTRNRQVASALKPEKAGDSVSRRACQEAIGNLAKQCDAAGADVLEINLQQCLDAPSVMEFAVKAVQSVTNCRVCLSANNPDTLEAGLKCAKGAAIVNYVSLDTKRLESMLPLAVKYGAEVVLLATDPIPASGAEELLKASAVLIGAANEAGVPNERILVDPGVMHVTASAGQRHSRELADLIPALMETFDPPVRTIAWVGNSSTGAHRRIRPIINRAFLGWLAGLGVSAAFMDVLDRDLMRTQRLIRVFRDELIYTDREMER